MEKIQKRESLADIAYRTIKKAIITGKLAPNEELPEEKIATDLGISRTPLREALKRLALESLVVIQNGRPAVVATFTKEDALHFMELRSVLETYNIEKIAKLITNDLLFDLKQNLKDQLEAISADNFQEFIDLDREFHLLLASYNPNTKLREMIHLNNTGVNRAFLLLSNTVHLSAEEAYKEHESIVFALEQNDSKQAKEKMVIHMANIEHRFLNYFKGEEK